MSDNNVQEVVPEDVKEVENKSDMPPTKKEEAPVITNPEPVKDTPKVNKKLPAMSKNTKEKQKNRKLAKPTTVSRAPPKGFSLDINPVYLFGILGVIIAGASLWYQRKSYLRNEVERSDDDSGSGPVQSTGGEHNEPSKKSPPKTAKRQPFDPWEWKREHQQTGVLPGNYDFPAFLRDPN